VPGPFDVQHQPGRIVEGEVFHRDLAVHRDDDLGTISDRRDTHALDGCQGGEDGHPERHERAHPYAPSGSLRFSSRTSCRTTPKLLTAKRTRRGPTSRTRALPTVSPRRTR